MSIPRYAAASGFIILVILMAAWTAAAVHAGSGPGDMGESAALAPANTAAPPTAWLLAPGSQAQSGRCYVNAAATGGVHDGTSWATAHLTLQDALANSNCTDIWVAKGVYYPDEGAGQTNDARNSTFRLKNGVAIYGGFAGTETARGQRDPAANITVLSGDIDKNDTNTGGDFIAETTGDIVGANAHHVVSGSGADGSAVLDGFTVTAGQANGSSTAINRGGGMFNNYSSKPKLVNVILANNTGGDCRNVFGASLNSNSSNNLVEAPGGCTLSGANNILGQDPNLGALTDFGGPGRQVFPLLAGSPAIDAGTNTGCPATDQRGAARPQDGDGSGAATCDMGAYEKDVAPTPTPTNTPTSTPTNTPTHIL